MRASEVVAVHAQVQTGGGDARWALWAQTEHGERLELLRGLESREEADSLVDVIGDQLDFQDDD